MKANNRVAKLDLCQAVNDQLKTNYSRKDLDKEIAALIERDYLEERNGMLIYVP